jgi:phage/plasmid-like protein (TIGR03299 family)
MAHNINKMVYAGETPWHGLGKKLPENGTWEEIRAAADFYRAVERPLYMAGRTEALPDRKALCREDNGEYLAVAGIGYEILQFEDLAETGVQAAGGVDAIWHTAGTLGKNGIRGWLLGELPNPITVKGDPTEIRKYILLTTAHEPGNAAILKNVATRTVCQNTLGSALAERSAEWKIHHTKNAKQRLEDAGRAFASVVAGYETFGRLANALAATKVSQAQVKAVIDAILPVPKDDKNHSRIETQREEVLAMHETATGLSAGIRGTAWGSLQAWTEWADHGRESRALPGRTAESVKLESIWMGRSAQLKQKAMAELLTVTGLKDKFARVEA